MTTLWTYIIGPGLNGLLAFVVFLIWLRHLIDNPSSKEARNEYVHPTIMLMLGIWGWIVTFLPKTGDPIETAACAAAITLGIFPLGPMVGVVLGMFVEDFWRGWFLNLNKEGK